MNFSVTSLMVISALFFANSANATVVNISALWGENATVFNDPYPGVKGVGTTLYLTAGEYFVTPVDQSFAGAKYTAASRSGPASYEWGYYLSIDGAPGVKYGYGEGPPTAEWHYWSTPGQAFSAAPAPSSFTLENDTSVVFYWRDDAFGDNLGGISLNVTPAVPEPATYGMLLVGMILLAGIHSRRGKLKLKN